MAESSGFPGTCSRTVGTLPTALVSCQGTDAGDRINNCSGLRPLHTDASAPERTVESRRPNRPLNREAKPHKPPMIASLTVRSSIGGMRLECRPEGRGSTGAPPPRPPRIRSLRTRPPRTRAHPSINQPVTGSSLGCRCVAVRSPPRAPQRHSRRQGACAGVRTQFRLPR